MSGGKKPHDLAPKMSPLGLEGEVANAPSIATANSHRGSKGNKPVIFMADFVSNKEGRLVLEKESQLCEKNERLLGRSFRDEDIVVVVKKSFLDQRNSCQILY